MSTPLDLTQCRVRPMRSADLSAVERNEQRSYQFPWSRGIFSDCLVANHECSVVEYQDRLLGHAIASVAAGESHLLNLCVSREWQGYGLGRFLVLDTLERLYQRGAAQVFLEVRPTNVVAVQLYESLGFLEIGVRKDYYPAALGHEDAKVMALDLAAYVGVAQN